MPRKYYYFPGSMYKTYYNYLCALAIVININKKLKFSNFAVD